MLDLKKAKMVLKSNTGLHGYLPHKTCALCIVFYFMIIGVKKLYSKFIGMLPIIFVLTKLYDDFLKQVFRKTSKRILTPYLK